MNEDLYSTKWVASELGMSDKGIKNRCVLIGVVPTEFRRKHYYTLEQIEQVRNFKNIRNTTIKHEKHDEIILYWKASNENSARQIAEKFNVKDYQVNLILNKYLQGLKPQL